MAEKAQEKSDLTIQQKVFLSETGREMLHELADEKQVSLSRVVEDLIIDAKTKPRPRA